MAEWDSITQTKMESNPQKGVLNYSERAIQKILLKKILCDHRGR